MAETVRDKKKPLYDVVGIGNAIVDVLAHVDDAFLERHTLAKGTMALVDADQARAVYAAMPPGTEASGGSVANSMAGIASLGGRGAYIGKVRNDQLGEVFAHDLRALGVEFRTAPATAGPATARCFVFVTPDAQRTMNTFLGACIHLGPEDVDGATVAAGKITYLEGYLWDSPRAIAAMRKAIAIAHEAGRKVAFSLSDPFCVDRHRDEFRALVEDEIDILFANEAEICSLYQADHFDRALQSVHARGDLVAALTRSAKGAVVAIGAEVHVIDAVSVPRVIDTTGAGDLFAAGFLFGYTRGLDLGICGRLGTIAAGEVIGHFGARPETSLAALAREHLPELV